MTARGYLRGHPIYWDVEDQCWRFEDTDERTDETWADRPCGYCGLYGNSSKGDVDPCLGVLPGVTNACCGHGDPSEAYICFQGGLVIRGFEIDQFHQRHMSEEEQRLADEYADDLDTILKTRLEKYMTRTSGGYQPIGTSKGNPPKEE